MSAWTDIENATSYAYTPVDGDAGSYLQATAMYTDGEGSGKSMMAESANMVMIANTAPVFAEATAERSVAENTAAGMAIGAPVGATDAEHDTLTYTLGGDDDAASFDIDPDSGQIMTMAALDFEMKASYTVDVTAKDPSGLSATVMVTINVTDVDEMGTVTLPAMDPSVGTEIMATVTDPDMPMTSVTWQWASSSDMSTWADIGGATSASYTPVEADVTMYLRATAMYTDAHGPGKSEERSIGEHGQRPGDIGHG